ncbi:TrkH family potassium uptake protein [Paenibacillus rigui]|uniref:Ktr system potassium uptake protein D n=1 Tax=Paenibacillus rigui TaxID=554312 RepID=A0A229UG17_9BACL|nr:potassium transporter TrkG [Paenibacillus rigui]OXM82326.1 Ktr system potassium uptake protein D [Paenibacillus rigui]
MRRKSMARLSAARWIVISYFAATLLITVLLMLPISHKQGVHLSWIDGFFTAVSAVSVTGLTTVSTADTFSRFGAVILMIGFQLGGLGIMAMGSFYWLLLGQSIGLWQRKLLMIDQNRYNLSGIVYLIRLIIGITLLLEGISGIIFAFYFYYNGQAQGLGSALYYGLFHSVSAYTNAGFDLFGNSMIDYSHHYAVQTLTMLLIIMGGIGFPVLVELVSYLTQVKQPNRFRFSLYTKVTTFTFGILLVGGALGMWITEGSHAFANKNGSEVFFNSLFSSVTARSAGLATFNYAEVTDASKLLLSLLMFIGASPSSMGGGVRTTTIAVIVLSVLTFARGRTEIRVFKRSVRQEDVMKCYIFCATGAALVLSGIFAILIAEGHRFDLISVLFEVSSAFGTCGLSTGITSELSAPSKITLVLLMFIGRIGMMLFLTSMMSGRPQADLRYPEEKLIVG